MDERIVGCGSLFCCFSFLARRKSLLLGAERLYFPRGSFALSLHRFVENGSALEATEVRRTCVRNWAERGAVLCALVDEPLAVLI